MLGLSSGDKLLYVGDHIFADVVRSKRSLGWRTCLIIPELTFELTMHRKLSAEVTFLIRACSFHISVTDIVICKE